MSNIPTIPDFNLEVQQLAAAVRALKDAVEILAGLRQGESKGAPQVYVQPVEPNRALKNKYKIGDLWVNTSTDAVSYWSGSAWRAFV